MNEITHFKNGATWAGEALRKAILSTRGLKGIEGEYHFDQNGDGLHGYSIVRNDKGALAFVKHIEFSAEIK